MHGRVVDSISAWCRFNPVAIETFATNKDTNVGAVVTLLA
jgi:hypothetical protein